METPVAIISGAGGGIGRATAIRLARSGYQLALLGRTHNSLAQTVNLCGDGLIRVVDVAAADQVRQAIETIVERLGRIDVLVHCAGIAPVLSIAQMTPAQWREVIETNLSAAFYLCRAAWPTFERQKSGVVINVSSFAARDPFPGFAAYGAAKAGLNLFGLSAAREGQPIGVRVHTIAPAAVETPMFRKILSPEQYPTEKALSPEDVAQIIEACATGAMKYTSGEVIYIRKEL